MRYEVKLTAQAIGQIEEIVQYISRVLLAPETARKFLVYYLIDEDKKAVWVTAVIYGRRDQIAALEDALLGDKE